MDHVQSPWYILFLRLFCWFSTLILSLWARGWNTEQGVACLPPHLSSSLLFYWYPPRLGVDFICTESYSHPQSSKQPVNSHFWWHKCILCILVFSSMQECCLLWVEWELPSLVPSLLGRPQPSAWTAAILLLGIGLFCMFCYFGAQIVTRKVCLSEENLSVSL